MTIKETNQLIEDLEFWSLVAANIATVAFLAIEFVRLRKETREQKEQIEEQKDVLETQKKQLEVMEKKLYKDAYDRCRQDHTELVKMILNKPLLNRIHDHVPKEDKNWKDFSDDEKTICHYYVLHFDLFERLFTLYEERQIDELEWKQWMKWLKDISNNWLFEYLFNDISDILEPEFVKKVREKILKPK